MHKFRVCSPTLDRGYDDNKTHSQGSRYTFARPARVLLSSRSTRPNLRQRPLGVSAHGGDRRGQWNHVRTIPNNLEWHIDISVGTGLRWLLGIIENRSNRTQPAGQLWRTRNIPINQAQTKRSLTIALATSPGYKPFFSFYSTSLNWANGRRVIRLLYNNIALPPLLLYLSCYSLSVHLARCCYIVTLILKVISLYRNYFFGIYLYNFPYIYLSKFYIIR